MATQDERERKFLVLERHGPIPMFSDEENISQSYLWSFSPDIERRIRKSTEDGITTYTYTRKVKTKTVGVRKETEIKIPFILYLILFIFFRDIRVSTLKKVRYTYYFNTQRFEHDVYGGNQSGKETIEAERDTEEEIENIITPDFVECVDVTGVKGYSNFEIAKYGFPELKYGGNQ